MKKALCLIPAAGCSFAAIAFLWLPFGAQAGEPAPAKAQSNLEIRWMRSMIDHHHMAVMMSELCLERAIQPELVAACEMMSEVQSAEIEQLQAWLTEWYDVTYEPMMKPGDERMIARLAALEGEDFEVAFMQSMIRHHQAAIRSATTLLKRGYHEELKEMANMMIEMQSAEIEQLRAWLCEWYELCGGQKQQKMQNTNRRSMSAGVAHSGIPQRGFRR